MDTKNKTSVFQNKISTSVSKMISLSLFAILVISSAGNAQGAVVLFDDFNDGNLDGWDMYGFDGTTGTYASTPHGLNVSNGALQFTDNQLLATRSKANRNSTTTVGTWSIDTNVGSENTHFAFEFIFTEENGNYNETGLTSADREWNGYAIVITSSLQVGGLAGPGMTLLEFDSNELPFAQVKNAHTMAKEDIEGSHHIDVTRDENGVISVYNDMEFLFSETDVTTNYSEKIVFTYWTGSPSIDNVRVSDVVGDFPITTSSTTTSSTTTSSTTTSSTTTTSTTATSETVTSSVAETPIPILVWISPFFVMILRKKSHA